MQMNFSFLSSIVLQWSSMRTTYHCALEAHNWSIHHCFLEIGYEFFMRTKRGIYHFSNLYIYKRNLEAENTNFYWKSENSYEWFEENLNHCKRF